VWGKWEQNVIEFKSEWHLLSFSVMWVGERRPTTWALPDFKLYAKDKENDRDLAQKLWEVLNEADLVIAHNGDKFDIRKSNARFLINGFKPPSPYKTIDTLKIAKRNFKFNSNSLNDLAQLLGLGRKHKHTGFELWRKCMEGDLRAWATMKRYNAQDVVLLWKVYMKLRAWHSFHPNIALKKGQVHACPVCGSLNTIPDDWWYIVARRAQRYVCQDCGKYSKGATQKIPGVMLK
jgi:predicted RNA-binding Zn-ribbon protein involved in translation (DUF1610 family)/rRNA-processing protein FCF1